MGKTVKQNLNLTPRQDQRIEEAISRRGRIDYECFLKLRQLLPFVDAHDPEVRKAVSEADALLRKRDQANHDFFTALTGRG